ncbi:MAG: DNA alkylation repair protein [Alphaproteobacteria bacterium]|nr:DNA alkylation repair protein [Alphaproteobacteria bacterium]
MPTKIQNDLFNMRDEKFAQFNASLIPTTESKKVIGVRTPDLRKYAKTISDSDKFLSELPHKYFEENQIHAFILSDIRDIEKCINLIDVFLPYVDNWATCDQLIPKIFTKNLDILLTYIRKWIKSNHTYTVRFAIGLLMRFYLGEKFNSSYADMVIKVKSNEYYINMMRAWYFATALAKNWNDVIGIIENKKLDTWTHNKTIQKAIESYRITPQQKQFLITLKI